MVLGHTISSDTGNARNHHKPEAIYKSPVTCHAKELDLIELHFMTSLWDCIHFRVALNGE